MKIPLDLIKGVRIASPCPASWEQMTGDDRSRQCSLCNQRVYDLSAMTGAEVAHFLGAHDEDVCVRLYRRADGTVMTSDCPKGVRARMSAWVSCIAVAGLSLFGFFLFRGSSNPPWSTAKGLLTGRPGPTSRVVMGKTCIPKNVPPVKPRPQGKAGNDNPN
jgi:hypothetical protein